MLNNALIFLASTFYLTSIIIVYNTIVGKDYNFRVYVELMLYAIWLAIIATGIISFVF